VNEEKIPVGKELEKVEEDEANAFMDELDVDLDQD